VIRGSIICMPTQGFSSLPKTIRTLDGCDVQGKLTSERLVSTHSDPLLANVSAPVIVTFDLK